jgi:hypothetical protein
MELLCYKINGEYLDLLGICNNSSSILWTLNFFKGDTFTIKAPASAENVNLFKQGNVVELMKSTNSNFSDHCGIITAISIQQTMQGEQINVQGKSVDGMLDRRVLTEYATGDSFMTIFRKNAGDLALTIRKFPATSFVTNADFSGVFGEAMRFKKLSEYANTAGQFLGVGLRTTIAHNVVDIETGKYLKPYFIVEAYKGVDRTIGQAENKAVVFSDIYQNAINFEYDYNENGAVTSAIMYSEAKYDDKSQIDIESFLEYDDNETVGYKRIEKAVKITAATTNENRSTELTPEFWTVLDYKTTLQIAEKKRETIYIKPTNAFDCELQLTESYNKAFEIGDIITTQNSGWNITANKRITQIVELYVSNKTQIKATLGDPLKSLSEIIGSRWTNG